MEFWYILIGVVAAFFLFPYIRFLVKRLVCRSKIKGLCIKKGYTLHTTHRLWFLASKRSQICDCYIETKHEVFAIKFFGISKRRATLVFNDNGEYFVRKFIGIVSFGSAMHLPIDQKTTPLLRYDFRYNYKDEWEIKTPRHILLVNPVAMEFRFKKKHGEETVIGAGNIVYGMEIDSLPRLLSDLEDAL